MELWTTKERFLISKHALYIWEKATGTLMKILHGTKGEILLDVVWHPVRPIVASISQGVVTVWAQQQVSHMYTHTG